MNITSEYLEVQFFLHPGKNGVHGTVYVRITYGGKRLEIGSTGVRIEQTFWDVKRRQVKSSHPNAEAHNRAIERVKKRIEASYLDLLRRGRQTITVGSVKAHFLSEQEGPLTMSDCMDWYLQMKAKEVGTRLTHSSLLTFQRQGRNVQAFLLHARLTQQLADEFTPAVADRLVTFLREEKKHINAYINKHLDLVKAMLRMAFDAERISRNPLKRYSDLPEDDPDTTYLTEEEVSRIEALTNLGTRLAKCRAFLLFCVEAGTHYIDYRGMIRDGYIEDDPDGTRWLVSRRQKTGKPIEVPVTPRIERLLEEYGGLERLPVLSNVQFNNFLKILAERAEIDKVLTTKIGRKTFADTRLNRDGLSDLATSTMLGLTSPVYLKNYGSVRRERLKREMGTIRPSENK